MKFRAQLVAGLLFSSGLCALIYQVAWFRNFRLIFGTSTAASAAVMAIFLGGLGIGGLLIGPRADRHPRPLRLYAQLEAIVALSAAATPFLLMLARYLYLASGGTTTLGAVIATAERVVLSTLVLAVPTIAMGGTLPAAARAVTEETDVRRHDVAALYALNTLGAVVGCLLATFWLLERIGTQSTIWVAAGFNLLVALIATLVAQRVTPEAQPASNPRQRGKRAASKSEPREPREVEPQPDPSPRPELFLLLASGAIGFAFFLMEMIWYRLLAPLLSGSVFTFGLVLAVALAGIGIGGLLYRFSGRESPASLSKFASTCLLEAAAIAATFALGDRIAILTLALLPLRVAGFETQVACWTLVTVLVVLLPAIIAGFQFPLLIALFGRGRQAVSTHVGRAYAANTVGAILGSLAGGFGLLPWISAAGAWRLAAVVLLLLGAAAVILDQVRPERATRRSQLLLHATVALVTLVLLNATGPTAVWKHSGIGALRADAKEVLASVNAFRDWASMRRRAVVWEGDGRESSVALTREASGYAFFVNGKSDGSARGDAGTQVMLGLLGALSVPNPRQALVIGLGTGSSAGWLGRVPSIERVEVVELERLVVEVARACSPVNQDVLQNPKVVVTIGDARETLQTTHQHYDVIASEPSNPFRAGIASLFTLEYYRAAADRLTDDGVFVQWVQAYEIDTPTMRTIYKTLGSVFPQVETWQTDRDDVVLVASKRSHRYRASDLSRRIAQEPFASALAGAWRAVNVHGLVAHYLADDTFARSMAGGDADINTDDLNIVEFGLARSVGRRLFNVNDIRAAARASGASRPPLDDEATVDWPAVDTAYVSFNAAAETTLSGRYVGTPQEQVRQEALVRYYQNGEPDAARELWQQQPDPDRDPTETAMLADIAASAGDADEALSLIKRLSEHQPAEASALLATLRLTEGRLPEAATAVEAAMARLRTNPWPLQRFKERVIDIATTIADRDPTLARRMIEALAQPLAVGALEDIRLTARANMTRQTEFADRCRDAVAELEPNVPWTEAFLQLRQDCYTAAHDTRLAAAQRDLRDFRSTLRQPVLIDNPQSSRPSRPLSAQEVAALSGRAELSYGTGYRGTIYNGNKSVTVTEITAEISTLVDGKTSRATRAIRVTIPPLSTGEVTFDVVVRAGTRYAWGIVSASGYP